MMMFPAALHFCWRQFPNHSGRRWLSHAWTGHQIRFMSWMTMTGWWFGIWNKFFSIYWESHHPNWLMFCLSEG
jgi:hypothetical protein